VPHVEFLDGADDEPSHPRRAAPPRAVLGLSALVAVLVLGFLAGRSSARTHPTSAPAPTVTVTASPSASVAAPVRVNRSAALDFTGVFSTSGSLGSRTVGYAFGLVNLTAQNLQVRYPIDLIGQDGTTIPTVFAGLYDDSVALDQINSFTPPAHRIDVVRAGSGATLLLSVRIDCNNPAVTAAVQPFVRITLAGSGAAADFALPRLASGFQDAVSQICG
jgi:hypothetical protein